MILVTANIINPRTKAIASKGKLKAKIDSTAELSASMVAIKIFPIPPVKPVEARRVRAAAPSPRQWL